MNRNLPQYDIRTERLQSSENLKKDLLTRSSQKVQQTFNNSKKYKILLIVTGSIVAVLIVIIATLGGVLGAKRMNQSQNKYLFGNIYQKQISDILSQMSQQEKIGQLIQPSRGELGDVTQSLAKYSFGTILSAGGQGPTYPKQSFTMQSNNAKQWYNMVSTYLGVYTKYKSKVPLMYAIDGVHGHNSVSGATIFPHNIGMGCTNDQNLLTQQGRVVAEELRATGILWNFSPFVSVPDDIRWGRTYEGYSEDANINAQMGVAYLKGCQSPLNSTHSWPISMCTSKHFIADGQWVWGQGVDPDNWVLGGGPNKLSQTDEAFTIDEGQFQINDNQIRNQPAIPHAAMIDNGVMSVMISYGRSLNDNISTIINPKLVTDLLRKQLGFKGIALTDWEAVGRVYPKQDQATSIKQAFDAGIDVFMVGSSYKLVSDTLNDLVKYGKITIGQINDRVKHVLEVKFHMGVFEEPVPKDNTQVIFSQAHQDVATQAVQKSLVLLQNNNKALPIKLGSTSSIGVFGRGANNLGMLCGGWTLDWQGGNFTSSALSGFNIIQGLSNYINSSNVAKKPILDLYNDTSLVGSTHTSSNKYSVGIYVLAEYPTVTYAEGNGDYKSPTLNPVDIADLQKARSIVDSLVVIILSGRPVQIDSAVIQNSDAIVAAWLPGNLGGKGIANVIFGDVNFSGKLSFTWPRNFTNYSGQPDLRRSSNNVMYPRGYGLQF